MFTLIFIIMSVLLVLSWILISNSLVNFVYLIIYLIVIWRAYKVFES